MDFFFFFLPALEMWRQEGSGETSIPKLSTGCERLDTVLRGVLEQLVLVCEKCSHVSVLLSDSHEMSCETVALNVWLAMLRAASH